MLQHIINTISPFLNIEWPKVPTRVVYTPLENGTDNIAIEVNLEEMSENFIETWMNTFNAPFRRYPISDNQMAVIYELPRTTIVIAAFVPQGFLR